MVGLNSVQSLVPPCILILAVLYSIQLSIIKATPLSKILILPITTYAYITGEKEKNLSTKSDPYKKKLLPLSLVFYKLKKKLE